MAFLTEDRKEQGLFLPLSTITNTAVASWDRLRIRGGWISGDRERREAGAWTGRLAVRCASPDQVVAELSGGNQQKVLISRWLLRESQLLIFDEPTRGIDIGARFEIYQWLDRLANDGKAIIVVSSDLTELMGICDRIAVMSAGKLAATFDRDHWTQEKIMEAALSEYVLASNTGDQ
jgi:ribose transport system ATP-binding protein